MQSERVKVFVTAAPSDAPSDTVAVSAKAVRVGSRTFACEHSFPSPSAAEAEANPTNPRISAQRREFASTVLQPLLDAGSDLGVPGALVVWGSSTRGMVGHRVTAPGSINSSMPAEPLDIDGAPSAADSESTAGDQNHILPAALYDFIATDIPSMCDMVEVGVFAAPRGAVPSPPPQPFPDPDTVAGSAHTHALDGAPLAEPAEQDLDTATDNTLESLPAGEGRVPAGESHDSVSFVDVLHDNAKVTLAMAPQGYPGVVPCGLRYLRAPGASVHNAVDLDLEEGVVSPADLAATIANTVARCGATYDPQGIHDAVVVDMVLHKVAIGAGESQSASSKHSPTSDRPASTLGSSGKKGLKEGAPPSFFTRVVMTWIFEQKTVEAVIKAPAANRTGLRALCADFFGGPWRTHAVVAIDAAEAKGTLKALQLTSPASAVMNVFRATTVSGSAVSSPVTTLKRSEADMLRKLRDDEVSFDAPSTSKLPSATLTFDGLRDVAPSGTAVAAYLSDRAEVAMDAVVAVIEAACSAADSPLSGDNLTTALNQQTGHLESSHEQQRQQQGSDSDVAAGKTEAIGRHGSVSLEAPLQTAEGSTSGAGGGEAAGGKARSGRRRSSLLAELEEGAQLLHATTPTPARDRSSPAPAFESPPGPSTNTLTFESPNGDHATPRSGHERSRGSPAVNASPVTDGNDDRSSNSAGTDIEQACRPARGGDGGGKHSGSNDDPRHIREVSSSDDADQTEKTEKTVAEPAQSGMSSFAGSPCRDDTNSETVGAGHASSSQQRHHQQVAGSGARQTQSSPIGQNGAVQASTNDSGNANDSAGPYPDTASDLPSEISRGTARPQSALGRRSIDSELQASPLFHGNQHGHGLGSNQDLRYPHVHRSNSTPVHPPVPMQHEDDDTSDDASAEASSRDTSPGRSSHHHLHHHGSHHHDKETSSVLQDESQSEGGGRGPPSTRTPSVGPSYTSGFVTPDLNFRRGSQDGGTVTPGAVQPSRDIAGTAALRGRVEQLEDKVTDMAHENARLVTRLADTAQQRDQYAADAARLKARAQDLSASLSASSVSECDKLRAEVTMQASRISELERLLHAAQAAAQAAQVAAAAATDAANEALLHQQPAHALSSGYGRAPSTDRMHHTPRDRSHASPYSTHGDTHPPQNIPRGPSPGQLAAIALTRSLSGSLHEDHHSHHSRGSSVHGHGVEPLRRSTSRGSSASAEAHRRSPVATPGTVAELTMSARHASPDLQLNSRLSGDPGRTSLNSATGAGGVTRRRSVSMLEAEDRSPYGMDPRRSDDVALTSPRPGPGGRSSPKLTSGMLPSPIPHVHHAVVSSSQPAQEASEQQHTTAAAALPAAVYSGQVPVKRPTGTAAAVASSPRPAVRGQRATLGHRSASGSASSVGLRRSAATTGAGSYRVSPVAGGGAGSAATATSGAPLQRTNSNNRAPSPQGVKRPASPLSRTSTNMTSAPGPTTHRTMNSTLGGTGAPSNNAAGANMASSTTTTPRVTRPAGVARNPRAMTQPSPLTDSPIAADTDAMVQPIRSYARPSGVRSAVSGPAVAQPRAVPTATRRTPLARTSQGTRGASPRAAPVTSRNSAQRLGTPTGAAASRRASPSVTSPSGVTARDTPSARLGSPGYVRRESPQHARKVLQSATFLQSTALSASRTPAHTGEPRVSTPAQCREMLGSLKNTAEGRVVRSTSGEVVSTVRPQLVTPVLAEEPFRSSKFETTYRPTRLVRHNAWETPDEVTKGHEV